MHGKPTSAAAASANFHGVRDTGTRAVSRPIFLHRDIEATTVFGTSMASAVAPIMVTPNSSKHALPLQLQRAVQRRLAAMVGSTASGRRFLFDDFAYHFPVNRLDVGGIPAISGSVMMVAGLEFTRITR